MKHIYKLLTIALLFAIIFASCNSSKYSGGASHNHGVNTRGFSGY
ncbi:MAG TPA: hypothetical protein VG847_06945 [Chitinophagaceae bacterium]|nr:hypothetical protein [Chitinophagaceae bacterium]